MIAFTDNERTTQCGGLMAAEGSGSRIRWKRMDPFQIDPHKLHEELLRQLGLTRDAGKQEADARHVHDQAKARLAVVEARLSLAIRTNPGKFNLREKPTVDEIGAAVLLQPEHDKATRELSDARYGMDICSTASVAMVDRRKALECLVRLLELNYYSEREPTLSPAGRERMERRAPEHDRSGVTDFQ